MGSKSLDQVDEAFFDSHFNLNAKSPLFLTQLAVPHMVPGMLFHLTSDVIIEYLFRLKNYFLLLFIDAGDNGSTK